MKLFLVTQTVDKNDPILGFMLGWITEFSRHFDEVYVLCLGKGTYDLPDNVHVYSLGKERGRVKLLQLITFYWRFGTIFFKQKPTHVFFHMGAILNVLAAPFYLLRRYTETTFLWWKAHGRINWLGRLALWFVDEVVTSTASGFPIATKKRRIVGQAIDTSVFTMSANTKRQGKRVVFVGRIMPVKQLEMLIETARLLEPQGFIFEVVGPALDAEYYAALQQQAADTSIIWSGSTTHADLAAVYQQAGIFLNPSMTHSMDKTVLEAMLCGCIPVTANRAFAEMLAPFGLYIEEPTAKKYATLISAVSDHDQSELQASLHDITEERHSLSTFGERIFML